MKVLNFVNGVRRNVSLALAKDNIIRTAVILALIEFYQP